MRIAILCQFDAHTACGIHMRGKADALTDLGHEVELVHHPFKFERRFPRQESREGPRLRSHSICSAFFGSGRMRWARLPALLLRDIPAVYRLLARSDMVLIHKALPLGMLYMALLRIARYRGRIFCVLDDWEGIGGMASLRNPDKILPKLLVTAAEECMPIWADGNICVSRLLEERLALSSRTAGKALYLPLGASARNAANPAARVEKEGFTAGYVGTFKSPRLIAFLADVMEETLRRDASVRFVLVGGGEGLETLRARVDGLGRGNGIRITGQVPHARVFETLRTFDLCILFLNDRFPEAYLDASRSSTKLFEYMALARPILASRFGEPARLLRDGETAWLAENEPAAFADAIIRAKAHPEERARLGAAVRQEFLARYSHEVLMAHFLEWAERR